MNFEINFLNLVKINVLSYINQSNNRMYLTNTMKEKNVVVLFIPNIIPIKEKLGNEMNVKKNFVRKQSS